MTIFQSFAVIPAAGASARMGTPKLLLPWRGKAIIEQVIDTWQAGGATEVLTVVRADDNELAALARQRGATVVVADPPPIDMKASVRTGLAFVAKHFQPTFGDVWLTAPADLPLLSADVIRRLLRERQAATPAVLVACHQGRHGHPVLFPWSYAARLEDLAADEGLNRLVELAQPALIECGESAICADLDTPADYERLQGEAPP